jgi:hypothetical protein
MLDQAEELHSSDVMTHQLPETQKGSNKKLYQVQGNDVSIHLKGSLINEANHTAENIKVAQDADLFPEVPKQTQNPIEASVLGLPQVEPVRDAAMPNRLTLKVKQVIKYLLGKCWGPKGLSLVKDLTGYKNVHSLISGYGPDRRPNQLLTAKMILAYVSVEYLNCGGWNTMRDVINQKFLEPTEEALEKLKNTLYLSDQADFASLRESIELIHRMHYNDAPSLFFLVSHFYKCLYKLIGKASSNSNLNAIMNALSAQALGESNPVVSITPRELARLNTILNEMAVILKRLSVILGGVDWVENTPNGKVDQVHTYFNQDILFTPGNLIFIIDATTTPVDNDVILPDQSLGPSEQSDRAVYLSSNIDDAPVFESEQASVYGPFEDQERYELNIQNSSEPSIVDAPSNVCNEYQDLLKMCYIRDNQSQDCSDLQQDLAIPLLMQNYHDHN